MARSALNVLVGASLSPLEKGLKKGVGLVKNFSKEAGRLVTGGGGIGAAISAAVGGISVAAGLKMALDRFKEIESAGVRLQSTLKATGASAGVSVQQIGNFAKELQATTGVAASATMDAAGAFARAGITDQATIKAAINQAANLAAVMGGELAPSADQLASAMKNPREGYLELAQAGVRFSDSQIDTIQRLQASGDMLGAQKALVDAVKQSYDGAAEAAGGTLDGAINKLWGSIGQLAATIGEALAPYIQAAVGLMQEWVTGLDNAGTKNTILEYTAKAVGWIVDGVQVLSIAWKACQVVVDAFLVVAVKGFRVLAQGVAYVVDGLAALGVVSGSTAQGFNDFIDSVKEFENGAVKGMQDDAGKLVAAWQKPWESTKTDSFFGKVQADVKKTAAATESSGKKMAEAFKKPADQLKLLSKEAIEAQTAATNMVKDLKLQLDNFGLDDYESQARSLEKKGATKGQVDEVRKLGAQLKGKELAQSLETPFERFEREMKKLEDLAAAGGIAGKDLDRAKGKLVADLQGALPENKIQAGGPLMQGSQEARSALLSFRNAGRNSNPQEALKRLAEKQQDELVKQTKYLAEISKSGKTTTGPFDGL